LACGLPGGKRDAERRRRHSHEHDRGQLNGDPGSFDPDSFDPNRAGIELDVSLGAARAVLGSLVIQVLDDSSLWFLEKPLSAPNDTDLSAAP